MDERAKRPSYPPPDHILTSLGIEFAWRDERVLDARASVPATLLRRAGRAGGVGPLVPLVDVVGGSCLTRHLDGDWMATSDVWIHERHPLGDGDIELEATVLRAGSRSLVAAVEIRSGGTPSAHATVEFTRIRRDSSRHSGVPASPTGEWRRMGSGPLLDRPVDEACGIRVVDASIGHAEVDRADFVANSIGTLQGGVVALLADASATAMVGNTARTVDLQFRFLAQTGVGPAKATGEILRTDLDGTVVRVEVVDKNDDALVGWAVCRVAA